MFRNIFKIFKKEAVPDNSVSVKDAVLLLGYRFAGHCRSAETRAAGEREFYDGLKTTLTDAKVIPPQADAHPSVSAFPLLSCNGFVTGNVIPLKVLEGQQDMTDRLNAVLPSHVRVYDVIETSPHFHINSWDGAVCSCYIPTCLLNSSAKNYLGHRINEATISRLHDTSKQFCSLTDFKAFSGDGSMTDNNAITKFDILPCFHQNACEYIQLVVGFRGLTIEEVQKVIGVSLAVARHDIELEEVLESSVNIQLPNYPRLMLDQVQFETYNKSLEGNKEYRQIDWSTLQSVQNEFKRKMFLPGMVEQDTNTFWWNEYIFRPSEFSSIRPAEFSSTAELSSTAEFSSVQPAELSTQETKVETNVETSDGNNMTSHTDINNSESVQIDKADSIVGEAVQIDNVDSIVSETVQIDQADSIVSEAVSSPVLQNDDQLADSHGEVEPGSEVEPKSDHLDTEVGVVSSDSILKTAIDEHADDVELTDTGMDNVTTQADMKTAIAQARKNTIEEHLNNVDHTDMDIVITQADLKTAIAQARKKKESRSVNKKIRTEVTTSDSIFENVLKETNVESSDAKRSQLGKKMKSKSVTIETKPELSSSDSILEEKLGAVISGDDGESVRRLKERLAMRSNTTKQTEDIVASNPENNTSNFHDKFLDFAESSIEGFEAYVTAVVKDPIVLEGDGNEIYLVREDYQGNVVDLAKDNSEQFWGFYKTLDQIELTACAVKDLCDDLQAVLGDVMLDVKDRKIKSRLTRLNTRNNGTQEKLESFIKQIQASKNSLDETIDELIEMPFDDSRDSSLLNEETLIKETGTNKTDKYSSDSDTENIDKESSYINNTIGEIDKSQRDTYKENKIAGTKAKKGSKAIKKDKSEFSSPSENIYKELSFSEIESMIREMEQSERETSIKNIITGTKAKKGSKSIKKDKAESSSPPEFIDNEADSLNVMKDTDSTSITSATTKTRARKQPEKKTKKEQKTFVPKLEDLW